MKEPDTLESVYDKFSGIECYFIWDKYDPRGFDEVGLSTELNIHMVKENDRVKFQATLDCVSDGCGCINLHWETELFKTAEDAILDLGKIFNDGLFIRDNLSTKDRSEFWVGPSSDIPEPHDLA